MLNSSYYFPTSKIILKSSLFLTSKLLHSKCFSTLDHILTSLLSIPSPRSLCNLRQTIVYILRLHMYASCILCIFTIGYRQLVYDSHSNFRIHSELGQPFTLRCPINNTNNEKVLWFQHAGYQILHSKEDGTIQFSTIAKDDLGTYYCTLNSDFKRAELQLPVRKVLLTAESHGQSKCQILSLKYSARDPHCSIMIATRKRLTMYWIHFVANCSVHVSRSHKYVSNNRYHRF